jgi:2-deoxy-scyllo-inosamine dehydrogenase (SAM-dependent)
MFSSIAIETSSWCNRRCAFCPNSVSPRSKSEEFMPLDLIEKVLNDLAAIGYRKRVELYIYN